MIIRSGEISVRSDFQTPKQPQAQKWISIKDQEPPKDGSHFLCYDATHDEAKIYVVKYVAAYIPFCGNEVIPEKWEEAAGEGYFTWDPTYWMPLPEAPRK